MKKLFDYLFGWLKESNRMAHLKVGCIISAVMYVLCAVFNMYVYFGITRDVRADFAITSVLFASVVAFVTTLIAMMSVEYIQNKMGGKWDNKDIYAGVLVPFCLSVASFIVYLTII